MRHKSFISLNSKSRLMNGFTIVELLVVITVIAILAGVTIVSYGNWRQSIAETEVINDLNSVVSAMDNARNWSDGYPTSIPATFKSSPNVGLSYYAGDTGKYCIDGVSNSKSDVTYYVDSSVGKTPIKGSCSKRPKTCPTGFIVVPGNSAFNTSDFCVMKYEAKNDGSGKAVSTASGLPWVSIAQTDAATASSTACTGCHLITDNEWLTIAHNVLNVASNWSGGAVGNNGYIYSGHSDDSPDSALAADTNDSNGYYGTGNSSDDTTATDDMIGKTQRRTLTLSNGEVIWDFAGNVDEWTNGTFAGTLPTPASSWTDWNNSSLIMNDLSSTFKPSYSEPAAVANFRSTQGLGSLWTGGGSGTGTRRLTRGGYWVSSSSAGVFSLTLGDIPSDQSRFVGFRVAQE